MPKLQITNVGLATAIIKDFEGYTTFVMEVAGGHTETKDVSVDVLQRIAAQLRSMEIPIVDPNAGTLLVAIRWAVLASDDLDDRAMEEGLAGLPTLTELQLGNYSPSLGATGVLAVGSGLLGNQITATGYIANAANTARINLAATLPGAPSNAYALAIATPAGGSTVVAVVGDTITVTPLAGGDTAANIVTAINAHATAKLMVQATVGTGGNFTAAVAAQKLSGGVGPGVSLSLNGAACLLTEVLDTQLTFDIPTGISANGRVVPLEYRNGPHVSRLTVSTSAGNYDNTTRPLPATAPVGMMIFNTDDGAPNWNNGTSWVDASGIPT